LTGRQNHVGPFRRTVPIILYYYYYYYNVVEEQLFRHPLLPLVPPGSAKHALWINVVLPPAEEQYGRKSHRRIHLAIYPHYFRYALIFFSLPLEDNHSGRMAISRIIMPCRYTSTYEPSINDDNNNYRINSWYLYTIDILVLLLHWAHGNHTTRSLPLTGGQWDRYEIHIVNLTSQVFSFEIVYIIRRRKNAHAKYINNGVGMQCKYHYLRTTIDARTDGV